MSGVLVHVHQADSIFLLQFLIDIQGHDVATKALVRCTSASSKRLRHLTSSCWNFRCAILPALRSLNMHVPRCDLALLHSLKVAGLFAVCCAFDIVRLLASMQWQGQAQSSCCASWLFSVLQVTLLAAGFVIGPAGCSVRAICEKSGANIQV